MQAARTLIAHLPFPVIPRLRRRSRHGFDFDIGHYEYGSAAFAGIAHRGAGHRHRFFENRAARFIQNAAVTVAASPGVRRSDTLVAWAMTGNRAANQIQINDNICAVFFFLFICKIQ